MCLKFISILHILYKEGERERDATCEENYHHVETRMIYESIKLFFLICILTMIKKETRRKRASTFFSLILANIKLIPKDKKC